MLLRRLQATHAAHAAVRHLLPPVAEGAEALTSYELTHQAVQQFIVNTHTEWFATVDPGLGKLLAVPLLLQDRADREWILCAKCFVVHVSLGEGPLSRKLLAVPLLLQDRADRKWKRVCMSLVHLLGC